MKETFGNIKSFSQDTIRGFMSLFGRDGRIVSIHVTLQMHSHYVVYMLLWPCMSLLIAELLLNV